MTFKEMTLQQDALRKIPFHQSESEEQGWINQVLTNQSPVMKLWFALMLLNCVVLFWI